MSDHSPKALNGSMTSDGEIIDVEEVIQTPQSIEQNQPAPIMEQPSLHPLTRKEQPQIRDDEYKPASCFQQTRALVRKNLLNKIRTPVSTFLELLSPAIFMLILVLGYSLSEERNVSSRSYAELEFDFPNEVLTTSLLSFIGASGVVGNVLDAIRDGVSSGMSGQLPQRNLLERKLSTLDHLFDYDEFDYDEHDSTIHNSDDPSLQWHKVHQLSRMLQSDNTTEEGFVDDDDLVGGYEEVAQSLNSLRREVSCHEKNAICLFISFILFDSHLVLGNCVFPTK